MASKRVINSEGSLHEFVSDLIETYNENKYLTVEVKICGRRRSISQNALYHIWIRQYAAHLLMINESKVDDKIMEDMKKHAKIKFYAETSQRFAIRESKNPWSNKRGYAPESSAKWDKGQMFMFLDWLQNKAADDGLILEAKGEFEKLKEESIA